MSLSLTQSPDPSAGEPCAQGEPCGSGSLLAAAQEEVLDALGIGVVACDATFHIVAASERARAILARLSPPAAPDLLPDPVAVVLRARAASPAKLPAGNQFVVVSARPVDVGWASFVVWLSLEASSGDLDSVLRRRWHLSRRQIDLAHQLRQGFRNQEIAAHLGLTTSTVKSYLSHLFDALGVHSRGEAIALIERARRGE